MLTFIDKDCNTCCWPTLYDIKTVGKLKFYKQSYSVLTSRAASLSNNTNLEVLGCGTPNSLHYSPC